LLTTGRPTVPAGYKAFRSELLRLPDLERCGFTIEPDITGTVCLRKLRVYKVPIAYYGRTYSEEKKIAWCDGFIAIWVLSRVRLTADRHA
jgi:hypothetical protein